MSADVESIGRWLTLAGGAFALVGGVLLALRKTGASLPVVLLLFVFGFGLGGVGAFGLPFIDKYDDFLSLVFSYLKEPTTEKASELLGDLAQTSLPENYRQLAETALVSRPVGDMDSLISAAVTKANAPDRAADLNRLQTRYGLELQARAALVNDELDAGPAERSPAELDAVRAFPKPLAELPQERLRRLKLDRQRLQRLQRGQTPPP